MTIVHKPKGDIIAVTEVDGVCDFAGLRPPDLDQSCAPRSRPGLPFGDGTALELCRSLTTSLDVPGLPVTAKACAEASHDTAVRAVRWDRTPV